VITVLVLFGFVVLRVLVLCGIAYLLIPPGRRCPACGGETVALERRGIARLLPGIQRRWCVDCGWSWFRRRKREAAAPARVLDGVRSRP
jgi:hypothetical protein